MAHKIDRDGHGEISSIDRGFDILEHLLAQGPTGVTELASALDIPKSTAHGYLSTLADREYVVNEDGTYRLSLRFLELGGEVRNRSRLYRIAKLEVDKLARETGEVANLGIEEQGWRVLLYKSEVPDAIHDNAPVGEYTQMHWTALGKAILAHRSREHVEWVLDAHGLPRATEHTTTDLDDFFRELEEIRERGYSVEDEDRRQGVLTVAAPIVDRQSDDVIAAVSVSGPKNRLMEQTTIDELANPVKSTANVIELRYSHY